MKSKNTEKPQISNPKSRICLTIAGLDPSGGAGIIADVKTFSAFGCFATAAISSLTFQNTTGVFGAIHQTAESVRGQVEPIVADFEIAALKTGMLPTREVIEEVARLVQANNLKNFVVDPVVRSTSGFDLIDDEALKILIEKLFPLADIVTPNLPEAERIANMKIENETDIEQAAKIMQRCGAKNVLIKGGHLSILDLGLRIADLENSEGQRTKDKGRTAKDFLFIGDDLHVFEAEWIETTATHGTGCTLAAAITANLALGKSLIEAVEIAKKFVTRAIKTAPNIGKGHSPIQISDSRARFQIGRKIRNPKSQI
ncbi:MAG: bifunctional hydroxymethylpyrimidine kinase/phosphomethylpyrimidine kinase [Acidobacteriota bacterium]|nr:bifunctional hydroxymethylpyrimidine kinase/phosphomethylpyrimidine kinase [Acidobacteriota bacterium]